MEAAASAARRATPWMPVEDVRRRGAFAVAGLKFAPSKKFTSAEGQGGVSPNSRRYDLSEDEETDGSAAAEEKARTKDSGSGSAPRPFVYKLYLPSASSSGEKSKSTDLAALRAGDRLVLSRERGGVVVGRVIVLDVVFDPLPHEVASGIEYAVAARVESERVVRFHGPGAATDADAWRVDRDDGGGTMSGRARAALVDAFASTNERAVALRRRLFELAPPAFDFDAADDALRALSPSGAAIVSALNDEQRSAVRGVLAARDYALIQGFPGAGKSATLAAIVRALVDAGKSVLVTSHTHSAVDNVLERLPGVGVDAFVRAGGEGGKASAAAAAFCPGGAKHAARSVEELRALADASAVVGATCYAAANHPLIARRRARRSARASAEETRDAAKNADETETGFFDVVLVDEAGQMTLPASVPALLRGAVFVLVGDPAQLPPLVQSERAAASGLSISPMQALAEAHPAAVFQLTAQYRMADDLAKISNVISYGGALRAANEQVASRVMRCLLSKTETDVVRALGLGSLGSANAEDSRQKNQRDAAWLVAASDPNRRVVFLDTSDGGDAAFETSDVGVVRESKSGPVRGNKHVNAYERFIVMRVLEALRARGAEPGSVAVLSPYNSQVDELDAELRRREAGTGDFGDAGNPEGTPFDLPIPEGVEALTIDRAQGRDVDCVVLSFCRANEARDAGRLLADRRRLNVALTRARSKLVLVGHGKTLARSPVLSQVLGVVLKNGWMVHLPPVT
jgi:DNA replication ATP-dependent helicase Dna2